MHFRKLIDNTATGILTGWSSALIFVLMAALSSEEFWKLYGTTIITTFATMAAAALAGAAVLTQVDAQQRSEMDRLKRRALASRAALPLVLADWSDSIQRTAT